jgi:hypothetical protein
MVTAEFAKALVPVDWIAPPLILSVALEPPRELFPLTIIIPSVMVNELPVP